MEWYTGPEGDQRVWYEPDEIESIMNEQLRVSKQRLTLEAPSPDLEAFLEQHLGADLDQFADLPEHVLGLTEFSSPPRVMINAELSLAADQQPSRPGARGRWRATLAHEAAHVILHRYLFDPNMARIRRGDFRDPIDEREQGTRALARTQCLHRDIHAVADAGTRQSRDWRELQANRGMAALLMPGSILRRVAQTEGGILGSPVSTDSEFGARLLTQISDRFDVSHQAATYRMQYFGFLV